MRKRNRINLHNLSQAELAKREENLLKGGTCACFSICPCAYAGDKEGDNDSYYGGSSEKDNADANAIINGNGNTK